MEHILETMNQRAKGASLSLSEAGPEAITTLCIVFHSAVLSHSAKYHISPQITVVRGLRYASGPQRFWASPWAASVCGRPFL